MRRLLMLSAVAVLVVLGLNLAPHSTTVDTVPTSLPTAPLNASYQDVFTGTNAYRVDRGHGALAYSASLERSAQERADHLCSTGDWSHDGWEKMAAAHTEYQRAAENLARGYSQTGAVDAWVESPAHERAMTGTYTVVGFGFSACNGRDYLVAHYAA